MEKGITDIAVVDGSPNDFNFSKIKMSIAVQSIFASLPWMLMEKRTTKQERKRLKKFIKTHMPAAKIRMQFDIAAKQWKDCEASFSQNEIDPSLSAIAASEMPVFMFHAHFTIFHPTLSEAKIAKLMKKEFPGSRRICFSQPLEKQINADGRETGGLEGWGEYASMEKTEVNFPNGNPNWDNVAVFKAMARFRKNWHRSSRRFEYGLRAKSSIDYCCLMDFLGRNIDRLNGSTSHTFEFVLKCDITDEQHSKQNNRYATHCLTGNVNLGVILHSDVPIDGTSSANNYHRRNRGLKPRKKLRKGILRLPYLCIFLTCGQSP